jgi:hypothetical protein
MPVISALRRLRQEDHKFEASLGYIAPKWYMSNESRRETIGEEERDQG